MKANQLKLIINAAEIVGDFIDQDGKIVLVIFREEV